MSNVPESTPENQSENAANELMNLAEYVMRDSPRSLRHARKVYTTACLELQKSIKRYFRRIKSDF
jgi:hypothetical protein